MNIIERRVCYKIKKDIKDKKGCEEELNWLDYFILKAIIHKEPSALSYIYGYKILPRPDLKNDIWCSGICIFLCLIIIIAIPIGLYFIISNKAIYYPDVYKTKVIHINECKDNTMLNITLSLNKTYQFTDTINMCDIFCGSKCKKYPCCLKFTKIDNRSLWYQIVNTTYTFMDVDDPNDHNILYVYSIIIAGFIITILLISSIFIFSLMWKSYQQYKDHMNYRPLDF